MKMRWILSVLLLTLPLEVSVAEEVFPSKPIRIVVPFQPGSQPDIVSRILGRRLGEVFKQQVIIDNRPGAGGLIGGDFAAKATPDGYTLVYVSSQHMLHKYLLKHVPYDFFTDLQPVQFIGTSSQVVVVRADLPADTLPQFVDLMKKRSGPALYGSAGMASPSHLAGHALSIAAGFAAIHVAYKGSPDALAALLGGTTDYLVTTMATAAPFIAAEKLKPLAVTNEARSVLLPKVPTIAEALPLGFTFEPWVAFATSVKVPEAVVSKLSNAIQCVLEERSIVEQLAQKGTHTIRIPREELTAYFRADEKKVAKWLVETGIRPE